MLYVIGQASGYLIIFALRMFCVLLAPTSVALVFLLISLFVLTTKLFLNLDDSQYNVQYLLFVSETVFKSLKLSNTTHSQKQSLKNLMS